MRATASAFGGFSTILGGYVTMTATMAATSGTRAMSRARWCAAWRCDAFFAIDGLLETLLTVLRQMDVFPAAIARKTSATSLPRHHTILMEAVKQGPARDRARGHQGACLGRPRAPLGGRADEADLLSRSRATPPRARKKILQGILSESHRFVGRRRTRWTLRRRGENARPEAQGRAD